MKEINYIILQQELKQIADMLLLNGTLVTCPGLISGKIGIAIFFLNYAHYTNNSLFEDYAMCLIEKIQCQIHRNSPANYKEGIAGIGVGIDYLVKNKLLNIEPDIFADFDEKMTQATINESWSGFSLYDGLVGYGKYWILRAQDRFISSQAKACLFHIAEQIENELSNISIKEQKDVCDFLIELQKIDGFACCDRLLYRCYEINMGINKSCFSPNNYIIDRIAYVNQCCKYLNTTLDNGRIFALNPIPPLDINRSAVNMGLLAGYAGEGLLRLTMLQYIEKSWISLL